MNHHADGSVLGSIAAEYLRQSAIRLARLSRKHFHVSGEADSLKIEQPPTAIDVAAFFAEYTAQIRPLGLSESKVLPPPAEERLRTFLWTPPIPNAVLNDLIRLSMYSDEVLVVDPFSKYVSNRRFTTAPMGPQARPDLWVRTCVNWALLACAIEPWVAAGIVTLVPHPTSFIEDHPPFLQMAEEAMARGMFSAHPDAEDIEEMMQNLALSASDSESLRALVLTAMPNLTAADLDIACSALDGYLAANPMRYAPPLLGPDLIAHGPGQNAFEASWLAERTGAFVVARGARQRKVFRMLSRGSTSADAEDALATAFAAVHLPMLNNVKLRAALHVRESGRASGFRSYLRDVWSAVSDIGDEKSPDRIRALADRLNDEYDRAHQDWVDIYRDLGITGGLSAAAATTAGLTIPAAVVPAAVAASQWLYRKYVPAIRDFRRRPAALLVELEHDSSDRLRRAATWVERHV